MGAGGSGRSGDVSSLQQPGRARVQPARKGAPSSRFEEATVGVTAQQEWFGTVAAVRTVATTTGFIGRPVKRQTRRAAGAAGITKIPSKTQTAVTSAVARRRGVIVLFMAYPFWRA